MPNYRRANLPGGIFFFTVITYHRRKILTRTESRAFLRMVINKTQKKYPFIIEAWVLLPEHLHCVWRMPQNDANYSLRWRLIKSGFSRHAKSLFHKPEQMTPSQKQRHEVTIWQRRFWEHQISDENDYQKHIDYIHYNPVKHGLVTRVKDWPYSTFHRYVKKGVYDENWGSHQIIQNGQSFGE